MRRPCLAAPPSSMTVAAMIAAAGVALSTRPVLAQPPAAQPASEVGADVTGRDFGGLLLEMPTQQGGFTVTCRSAWTWVEDAPAAPSAAGEKQTIGSAVQRMYLRGDVRMQIGSRRLTASRAVVWAERIDDGTAGEDKALYQVAVYFDRVANPVGASGAGTSGDRLLLTARVQGALTLAADAPPRSGRPVLAQTEDLIGEGERRLARYLAQLDDPAAAPEAPERLPRPDPSFNAAKYVPSLNRPYEPGSPYGPNGPRAPLTRLKTAPGLDIGFGSGSDTGGDQRLFSGRGVLLMAAGQPVLKTDGGENRVVITGGVVLQYSEPARDRGLQLSAQNAVIFLKPGKLEDIARAPAEMIQGIYLEGDVVATDNRFTLRAPYVYYDFVANQAYTVDAVFWTFDERRGLPLYVRADSIRQTTRNSITAKGVTIAASSFYDPMLSLGASSVTLSREPDGNSTRVMIDGANFAPRLGGLPFFWIPGYTGDIERFPIKDIRIENSSQSGFGLKTRWDAFGLTGLRPPDDWDSLDVDLLLDLWTERGLGIGADIRWLEEGNVGSLLAYGVPSDNGTDVLTSGLRRDRDNDGRGIALYEQRVDLEDGWALLAEATTVSDPNFVDAYFERLAETRREFASSATLRYTGENALFSLQVKGNFDDFAANEYLLQSQGYTVRKLPELVYTRIADDLSADGNPGTLLWTHEYRVGRVGLDFFKPTAEEFGYDRADPTGRRSALAALGMLPGDSYHDLFTAAGLTDDTVLRADTRQQLEWNLRSGPVRLQPFVVARATHYDDAFETFTADEEEQTRLWYGGGVRASTTLQRIYEGVNSPALDVHQIRHIIEPSVSFFSAGTNRRAETLPVFDWSVEGAQQGTAWRFGLAQTFQTQRGRSVDGQGGRTVDLLRWNTDVVNSTDDTGEGGRTGPFARYFEFRPEESVFGNYINSEAELKLTDATSLIAGATYDFDEHLTSRTSFGVLTDHGRDFRAYAELRRLKSNVPLFAPAPGDPERFLDSTFITFGGDYRLSSLYTLGLSASYNTDDNEIQDTALRINREFPDLTLTVRLRYNEITRETSMGLVFTPLGRNRRMENTRRLGRDSYLEPLIGTPAPTDAAP
ncbi:MAG TPA: LPS assembly protein LptD [Phycisphaerales bacterium]|nr:LPS assembly protein LptD [Phycisphaerales bacterium]